MNRKLATPVLLLIVFSMLLAACAPAATPAPTSTMAPTATTAPTSTPAPTATPVPTATATPEPAPDVAALWKDLIAGMPAEKGYGSVAAAALNTELADKPPFLLDVREASEVEKDGFIKGSVNIPVRDVLKSLDKLPAQDQAIVVLCASGHRGGMVLSALRLLGYTNVRNLGGGLAAWKKANLPTETGKPAEAKAGTAPTLKNQALYKLLNDFLSGLPEGFYTVKPDVLNASLAESKIFLLDVRTKKEYDETGRIAGATHIPFNDLFANLDKLPAKDAQIVIYCASGHRGAVAMMGLRLMGYTKISNLGGGLGAWKTAKLPVEGWVDWNVTWSDFLSQLPADFYSMAPAALNAALTEKPPFLLDVREASEVEKDGYIKGSVNIPVRELLKNLDKLPAQDAAIVVYCASGHRGGMAMAALRLLGYKNVVNLGGGLGAWKKANLATVTGKPEAATAGTAPKVDATRLAQLDAFLAGLPDGFNTVKPADLNAALATDKKPFVLDVRTTDEVSKDGSIEGSLNVPVNDLFKRIAELPKDKAAPIVVLCKSGHRGAMAMMALKMNGYTNVTNLGGGMNAWIAAQLPVKK